MSSFDIELEPEDNSFSRATAARDAIQKELARLQAQLKGMEAKIKATEAKLEGANEIVAAMKPQQSSARPSSVI